MNKREQVTKFDLEAAFKALDEIDVPKVRGLKPDRMNISESTKRVDRTSLLLEDYYNLNDRNDLQEASDEREAEIAKAKLARIEKIVDLDAETEEDVLPSYVGKTIVQCPQCMTLYYRNPEDLVADEDDPGVVNVSEQCPNCGHVDGFTVIGKVAAEEIPEGPQKEIPAEEAAAEEIPEEQPSEERPGEEPADEQPEEEASEEEIELEPIRDEDVEKGQEEANESLEVCEKCGKRPCECVEKDDGKPLVEETPECEGDGCEGKKGEEDKEPLVEDADLDAALDAHNEYIKYLQEQIEKEEKELAEVKNEEVKASIQKKIDGLKADLDAALPEAVKADVQAEELPTADEIPEEPKEESNESLQEGKSCEEGCEVKEDCVEEGREIEEKVCKVNKGINHSEGEAIDLKEDAGFEVTDAAIDAMLDSDEFKTPVSDAEVQGYLSEAKKLEEDDGDEYRQKSIDAKAELDRILRTWEDLDVSKCDEIDDCSLNEQFTKYLTEVYDNVKSFEMTGCEAVEEGLAVEGKIKFKSGKEKPTKFEFSSAGGNLLKGKNSDLAEGNAFTLRCHKDEKTNSLMTESLSYEYKIGEATVSGKTA